MSNTPDITPKDLSKAKVLGLDPGRRNIFTIAVPVGRDKFESHVLTNRRYYQESGVYAADENIIEWSRTIKDHLEALSKVSSKGMSLASHYEYLEEYLTHRKAFYAEYSKRRWARQRMRLYSGKMSCMTSFLSDVRRSCAASFGKDTRLIVAYGAAGFPPGGKGERSVPKKWALQMFRKRFETYLVDEFRSSRVNCKDDALLKGVLIEPGEKVRGLLWCDSTISGSGKFVDRDLNAAINIRRSFIQERLTGARPVALCRAACAAVRLPQQPPIGRIIPK